MAASDFVLILRLVPEAARRPKVLGFVGLVLFCFTILLAERLSCLYN